MNKKLIIFFVIFIMPINVIGKLQNVFIIRLLGSNTFILETEKSLFLIDAGYPKQEKRIVEKINTLNKRLELIILTHGHFDHFGSARKIKEATGALVGIHELDSDNLCKGKTPLDSVNFIGFWGKMILPLAQKILPPDPMCPDLKFKDGDSLDQYGLNARIVHTPGHTKGSMCIIVEDSIAFVGDLITNSPTLKKQSYYANSWTQIDQSIEKLLMKPFEKAYIGHYEKAISKSKIRLLLKKTEEKKN